MVGMMQNIRSMKGFLDRHNTAFLLCDLQESFRGILHKFDHVLLAANMMVKASRIMDIPLVVTEQYPKGLGHTCKEIDLQDSPNITIKAKTDFSMISKDVLSILEEKKIENVVLFGLETHICVQQTCLDLLDREYNVHIVVDACSSQREFDRTTALERMRSGGAYITTCESILFMMLRSARNENFKQISRLVKDYNTELKAEISSL